MFILGLLFLLYAFLKILFYGLYEFKEMNNKTGGCAICVLAVTSFIFSSFVIIHFYII
jgi:hypothetical protein